MVRRLRTIVMRLCAVALMVCAAQSATTAAFGQPAGLGNVPLGNSVNATPWAGSDASSPSALSSPSAVDAGSWNGSVASPYGGELAQPTPAGENWITPLEESDRIGDDGRYFEHDWGGRRVIGSGGAPFWVWQFLPDGLIYRSYQAGVREPRLAIVAFHERDGRDLWDGTLGGRVGLLRYGTCDELYPQGWQLDVEAAAIVRLTLDEIRDFETADYRVGVPLTYGIENWQFKFAVYHLSSHLGDEFAIANPGSLDDRINYVRDSLVVGASYYPHPVMRLYSEAAYAVNVDGGAEPWEFQFGTELSRPGPTGPHGTPFLAVNAHLREEHNFGGDLSTQAGWLWRSSEGQVMRAGLHYYNGKSSQYQTFDDSEQQIGFGLWYDY
jgi:hypothetical protein